MAHLEKSGPGQSTQTVRQALFLVCVIILLGLTPNMGCFDDDDEQVTSAVAIAVGRNATLASSRGEAQLRVILRSEMIFTPRLIFGPGLRRNSHPVVYDSRSGTRLPCLLRC